MHDLFQLQDRFSRRTFMKRTGGDELAYGSTVISNLTSYAMARVIQRRVHVRRPANPQGILPSGFGRVASFFLSLLITQVALGQSLTEATNSVSLGDATCVVKIELVQPYTVGPGSNPHRVSGTNCRFDVSTPSIAHDGATLSVTASEVEIGGTVLNLSMGSGGRVRFASTHFAHNTDLVIKWRAKFAYDDPVHSFSGSTTNWLEVSYTVKVYNKAGVYEIGQFALLGTGSAAAQVCFENSDHLVDMHRGDGWDVNVIGNEQPYQTAAHIGTHGLANGSLQYDTDPATWFSSSTIQGWRTTASNSNVPPVNLVFFDSCETGQSSSPTAMIDPILSVIDRAAVAFTVVIDANASQEGCSAFYEAIEAGKTVAVALSDYVAAYNATPKSGSYATLASGGNALVSGISTRD